MIVSIVVRTLALAAFVGLGIAWMADHDDAVGTLWVCSFVVAAVVTLWYALSDEARAGVSQLADMIPWPSKDPRDYM
jgi:phosphate starvation-inducible membrane PsiE